MAPIMQQVQQWPSQPTIHHPRALAAAECSIGQPSLHCCCQSHEQLVATWASALAPVAEVSAQAAASTRQVAGWPGLHLSFCIDAACQSPGTHHIAAAHMNQVSNVCSYAPHNCIWDQNCNTTENPNLPQHCYSRCTCSVCLAVPFQTRPASPNTAILRRSASRLRVTSHVYCLRISSPKMMWCHQYPVGAHHAQLCTPPQDVWGHTAVMQRDDPLAVLLLKNVGHTDPVRCQGRAK